METRQTAVEWLEEQINLTFYVAEASEMNKRFQIVFEQAKQIEKEQIIQTEKEMYNKLIEIYNETYNK